MKFSKTMLCAVAFTGMFHVANGLGSTKILVKNDTNTTIQASYASGKRMGLLLIEPGKDKLLENVGNLSLNVSSKYGYDPDAKKILISHPFKGLINSYQPSGRNPNVTITVKRDTKTNEIVGDLDV